MSQTSVTPGKESDEFANEEKMISQAAGENAAAPRDNGATAKTDNGEQKLKGSAGPEEKDIAD